MSTFQKKLQNDRSNEKTSNAGLKWEPEDDKYLLDNAKQGVEIKEIALALKRTEGSIKTRIIINILSMMTNDRSNLQNLCNEYGVTSDDISMYEEKKVQREEKRNSRNTYHYDKKNSFPSNDTAEILEGLSHLNKKMDNLFEKLNDLSKKVNK
tara:strand:- start:74 stop:532 length:459 start_codon:yes stop_codon:yes gene_type:complete